MIMMVSYIVSQCLTPQGHLRPPDAKKVEESWLSFWHPPSESAEPVWWLKDRKDQKDPGQESLGPWGLQRFHRDAPGG